MIAKRKRAQAMVEYVLVFAALAALCAAAWHFVRAARDAGDRSGALVGSDYP